MIEIERRFLVGTPPEELPEPIAIQQAYLATGEVSVRARRADDRFILTIKAGRGMVRNEIERDLTEAEFAVLWDAGGELRLTKQRYMIDLGDGAAAEYDVYGGDLAGRSLVEVEFPDVAAAEAFEPRDWFGREITDDPRFTNRALAQYGWPD